MARCCGCRSAGSRRERRFYGKTLEWSLENPGTILFVLVVAILLNFYLYFIVPKGFFPTEDTGQVFGGIRAGPTHLVPVDGNRSSRRS